MNKLYTTGNADFLFSSNSVAAVDCMGSSTSPNHHFPLNNINQSVSLNATSMNTDNINTSTMRKFFTFNYRRFAGNAVAKILMGMMLMMIGEVGIGQVNITPIRTDVSGFTSWTDVSVSGTTYVQLLTATSSTVSPAMNFNNYTGEALNFTARTFGGTTAAEIILTVAISTDNGTNWTVLGTRTPTSNTLTAQTPFDISSYNGTQVRLRFTVGGTSNTIGVGIDDISITGNSLPTINLSVSTNSSSEASPAAITVTATASAGVTGNQTVNLGVSGTSITTGDYTLSAGTITILSGATTGTATFTVVDDAIVEATETAVLTISTPSAGITLGGTTTQNISITDNDVPAFPTVSLSVSSSTATEANPTAITVTATASQAVTGDQTVNLGVTGTNIDGGDYSLSAATITIPNGQTTGIATFTVVDDALIEGTETATLTISNPSAGILLGSPTSQNITITDNDFPSVNLSVSTSAATEAAATVVTVTATASQAVVGAQTVALAVTGTGITAGDYSLSNTIITIASGQTTGTVSFTVVNDVLAEGTETAVLTISAPSAGVVLGATTIQNITITDNDVAAPVANTASLLTDNSFTANWSTVAGASSYRLDVSTQSNFTAVPAGGTSPWINEIHYDNAGTDAGEFVEIVVPAGYTGTNLTLTLYNGGNGQVYDTKLISALTQGSTSGAFTIYSYTYAVDGIQNGAPDGLAISDNAGLIQFLSYEGSFTATNGPANGVTSTDLLVTESNTTPLGFSLQLSGTAGIGYSGFTWQTEASATKGALNNGQTFGTPTGGSPAFVPGYNNLTVAVTSQSVTGLSENTTYYYRVRAVDGASNVSPNSSTISAKTTTLITITPDVNQSKGYGQTDPVFTYTASPSVTITGSLSRVAGELPGTYAYTIGTLSGGSDYTLQVGGTNTFTVNPVSITGANFRSRANGNFSIPATWEYDQGGNTWVIATAKPIASNRVFIGHNILLDESFVVGKSLDVSAPGTLTIAPNVNLEMADATSTIDFNNQLVTVKSTIDGTGSIGKLPGTLSDAGNVTVERYITGTLQRAWRLLSVPTVSGTQTIKEAWQENQAPGVVGTSNLGTQITGNYANITASQLLGFDDYTPGTSLLTYDPVTNNYVRVDNTNTKLVGSEPGYMLYVRGDRSKSRSSATTDFNETTLRTNGGIRQALAPISTDIPAGTSALVGNPFVSAIDLKNVSIEGGAVGASIFVWDPKLNTVGGYQQLTPDPITGTPTKYTISPGFGSYDVTPGTTIDTIEAGQAFFIEAVATQGTIRFTENSKVGGKRQVFRPSTPAAIEQRFFANLNLISTAGNRVIDGIYINLNDANSNEIDNFDTRKRNNFNENLAIKTKGINLGVEKRKPFANNDTVFLSTSALRNATYQFYFKADNLDPNLVATLEDNYLNTKTLVNPNGNSTYDFTVDANAASAASDRFRVVFKELGSGPLPVTFTSIKAAQQNNNIAVEWKVGNQLNIARYEVEKSADGRNFVKVAAIDAGAITTYNWLDVNAVQGANYYRVRAIDNNATFKYTQIVKITLGTKGAGISVSPNPVKGNSITLQFANQLAGKYKVNLTNAAGQLMYSNFMQHSGGSSSQTFTLYSHIIAGVYQLEIVAPDKTRKAQKLIIE